MGPMNHCTSFFWIAVIANIGIYRYREVGFPSIPSKRQAAAAAAAGAAASNFPEFQNFCHYEETNKIWR